MNACGSVRNKKHLIIILNYTCIKTFSEQFRYLPKGASKYFEKEDEGSITSKKPFLKS